MKKRHWKNCQISKVNIFICVKLQQSKIFVSIQSVLKIVLLDILKIYIIKIDFKWYILHNLYIRLNLINRTDFNQLHNIANKDFSNDFLCINHNSWIFWGHNTISRLYQKMWEKEDVKWHPHQLLKHRVSIK